MSDPKTLTIYRWKYEIGSTIIDVIIRNENELFISGPGQPLLQLIPNKPRIFHTKEFADFTFEFVIEDGKVTKMKQKDPSGEYEIMRK